ncbi:MAG: hypothetical protein U0W24_18830 [Bacteroidales bacterium]
MHCHKQPGIIGTGNLGHTNNSIKWSIPSGVLKASWKPVHVPLDRSKDIGPSCPVLHLVHPAELFAAAAKTKATPQSETRYAKALSRCK